MAQEFCTLEQAAQMLGISPQELNGMAQRREVRAFADRGTWRFRIADIEELARQRGTSSDADQPVITAQAAPPGEQDIFNEPLKKGSSHGSGSSDSGILLVPKGSDVELLPTPDELGPASSSFVFPSAKGGARPPRAQSQLPGEDEDESAVPIGKETTGGGTGDSQVRLDSLSGRLPDSGVRLVDFDLPSQLSGILPPPSSKKMEKPGSTVNLGPAPKSGKMPPAGGYEPTAQFDIEAQLADVEEARGQPPSSKKMKPVHGGSSQFELTPGPAVPGDSVFELSNPSMPSLELELTSDIEGPPSDAIDLGAKALKPEEGGTSRRKRPPISAEVLADESSGTFELKMESDEFEKMPASQERKPESSEFDLSLETEATSSSDFELTLDEDLGAPLMDSGPKTAKAPHGAAEAEETSDFELALDDDSSSELIDETDSEVVVIDDEDATAVAPVEGLDEAVVEEALEEEPEMEVVPKGAAAAAPAEWGWWSMALLPTVLIMPFVGLLLFEMMRSIWSYQQPYTVTGPIFRLISSITK
jgi:hypothetical protein